MRIINSLSVLIIVLLSISSCTNKADIQNITNQDKAPITEYSIAGKQVTVTYPGMKAEITYKSDSTLHWKTTTLDNQISEGDEKMNYKQIGDSLFFINWIEKDGITVSQVVDFRLNKVTVFLSLHDENSDRGQRGSTFFEGKLKENN